MTPSARLSPECRLVFRSADAAHEPSEFVALAASVRDWGRVVAMAEHEVATATLWSALRTSGAVIPPEATEHLRKSAMVRELRMQHLSRRLQVTTRMLGERDVRFLLLKGAATGALVDPTFRTRPMTDVDLLVRLEDVPAARDAIIASGWPETTDPVLRQLLADHHHLPPFVDPQMPGIRIELHTALHPADHSFGFDESHLWADAVPATAPFADALVPSREHLVLHACIHFAWQHTMQFGAWRTFRAVSLLANDPAFDWARFVRVARDAKAATACHWTLRLAQRMCGIAVPAGVLERLAPPTPEWLCGAIERTFIAVIAVGEGPTSPSVALTRLLWRAALRPHWSGHRTPGRWDPEHRWDRARGVHAEETVGRRLARHLAGSRDWWRFVSRTLLG